MQLGLANDGKKCWAAGMENTLNDIGLDAEWGNQFIGRPNLFLKTVKDKLEAQAQPEAVKFRRKINHRCWTDLRLDENKVQNLTRSFASHHTKENLYLPSTT